MPKFVISTTRVMPMLVNVLVEARDEREALVAMMNYRNRDPEAFWAHAAPGKMGLGCTSRVVDQFDDGSTVEAKLDLAFVEPSAGGVMTLNFVRPDGLKLDVQLDAGDAVLLLRQIFAASPKVAGDLMAETRRQLHMLGRHDTLLG